MAYYRALLSSLYGVNKQANKLVEEDLVSYCNVMAYSSIKICKSINRYINKHSSASSLLQTILISNIAGTNN